MRFRLAHAAEAGEPDAGLGEAVARLEEDFAAALADDLNVSAALAAVFGLVREVNVAIEERRLGGGDRRRVLDGLGRVDRVLGVLDPAEWRRDEPAASPNDDEIARRVGEREAARAAQDFAAADRIRNELAAAGIVLEDTPEETRWKSG